MNSKLQMFENRLSKVYKHRSKTAARQNISCYRVYDHDLPEFPFAIELYEDKLYVAEYLRRHGMSDEEHEQWLEEAIGVMSKVIGVNDDNIFLKQRRRMSHRSTNSQYQKQDEEAQFFVVMEGGLKFLVNLTDYLDTGLFLDHRTTRNMVRSECEGKNVLNLFCYTGSFSVYAAKGGAKSVTSVDLSKTYLQWAQDNFKANQLRDEHKYNFVHADVKQYLKDLPREHFELVVMDPPTFSNSKRMKDILDIQRDHVQLINETLQAMTTGGILYFSTNYTKFEIDSANIAASTIKDITRVTTPFDFEGKLKRWCYKIVK